MAIEEVKNKVQEVIFTLLPNANGEDFSEDTDIFTLGLDSINAMSLIFNLQDAFNVQFEADEIDPNNFRTLDKIVTLITQKK
jgi:acyl carrier protein